MIRDVVVPSALPETFTGIRLAVGMAYSSVVAAELFNGIPGIGGLVKDASNLQQHPGRAGRHLRHRHLRPGHRRFCFRAVERRAVPWRGKIMRISRRLLSAVGRSHALALAGCSVDQSGDATPTSRPFVLATKASRAAT